MEKLTSKEMEWVNGGNDFSSASGFAIFNKTTPATPSVPDIIPVVPTIPDTPAPVAPPHDDIAPTSFRDNMRKMFGSSAGRDLSKIAEKYGLVSVVNSIFGW